MSGTQPTPYELYEAARDQIRHENEVVNHRLGWFLAGEGFLLAGSVAGMGLYPSLMPFQHAWIFLTTGLIAIAAVGILMAVATHRTLGWAFEQQAFVAEWWNGSANAGAFPGITLPKPGAGWPRVRTRTLPLCVGVFWIVLSVALLAGLGTVLHQNQPSCRPAYSPVLKT
jgi:hypothetical protein